MVTLAAAAWAAPAPAHPGGVAKDGCHVERATGERHCHTPKPEPTDADKATCVDLPNCSTCGCRGGPGYRDVASGECVGYEDMEELCGTPPTRFCRFEDHENSGLNAQCVLGEAEAEDLLSRILPDTADRMN